MEEFDELEFIWPRIKGMMGGGMVASSDEGEVLDIVDVVVVGVRCIINNASCSPGWHLIM